MPNLLAWYIRHRRTLPWRENPTPYRVWISEVMLQQTQVATTLQAYKRFLKVFPSIQSLARASLNKVLAAWAGLGYYARAKNLRRAARQILRKHQGKFPEDAQSLLKLPGIGRYTAGAILSIAFGKPYSVLDGNVARVLCRLFALRGPPKTAPLQRKLWKIADQILDKGRPGEWNQAMMELGATVCLPQNPKCGICPLRNRCLAYAKDLQDQIPEAGEKKRWVDLTWKALWIEKGGKLLLFNRSENERFLKGHWGLPEERHLPRAKPAGFLKRISHTITHHRIWMEVYSAKLENGRLPPGALWVPKKKLSEYLVSSLWRKAL